MDAFLFAAGNGMRLRPITNNIQKCLLPVNGKPMLEWWLDAVFESNKFDKVFVNLHYLADDVERWLSRYEQRAKKTVYVLNEREELLGTAGTLRKFADNNKSFMVAYTDTFSHEMFSDMGKFVDAWNEKFMEHRVLAGLVSFDSPKDGSGSSMIMNGDIIESFTEKKDGDISWMGTMFANSEFLSLIKDEDKDLAHDVFSRLQGVMVAIGHVEAYDIGRGVEAYNGIIDRFQEQRKVSA